MTFDATSRAFRTDEQARPFDGRIIFDHLQKTAGQAVNAWLVRELGSRTVTPNLIGEHRSLIHSHGGDYAIISAHLSFRGEGLDPRYRYITCVREPLDRILSWLYFLKNHDGAQWATWQPDATAFLETEGTELSDKLLPTLQNFYVEHFAAVFDVSPRSESEKLTAALNTIFQFDIWGLYGELSEFVVDVATLIGMPAPERLDRVNQTQYRPPLDAISSKLRKRLEELCELDIEFFSFLSKHYRKHRQQHAVITPTNASPWLRYDVPLDRAFFASDFALISAVLECAPCVSPGQILPFTLVFSLTNTVPELEVGIHVFDNDRRWAFGTNTTLLEKRFFRIERGTHRIQYFLVTDLPEGQYTAGFAFAERSAEGNRELAWYDKLVEFRVVVPRPQVCVGYTSAAVEVSHVQIGDDVKGLIVDAAGTIVVCDLLGDLAAGEEFNLPIRLENTSAQRWSGTNLNPICLSYHWFDQHGESVVFDGERTAFAVAEVVPREPITMHVRVVAPNEPGHYRLVVLPLQEGRYWFDELGFKSGAIDVIVVPSTGNPNF